MEISSTKLLAVWRVKYKGYPQPTVVWYDNYGREITKLNSSEKTDKYLVDTQSDYTTLKINYLELQDSGIYTLKVYNQLLTSEKEFELVIKG